jgi:SAM-dependent methyltransferase
MEPIRQPLQGVWNIIRFNWHFYVLAALFALIIQIIQYYLTSRLLLLDVACYLILTTTFISLLVSWYVYDGSEFYKLNWMGLASAPPDAKMININAGFDETSTLIAAKFRSAQLVAFDFYDPEKHTEISIKRARKAYPNYPGTKQVNTSSIPVGSGYADKIFLILSAHEIRDDNERFAFFKELKRILKFTGEIIIVEHLRDIPNFLAYNIGFFHFLAESSWQNTFKNAGLVVKQQTKHTPFLTIFTLQKHADHP